MTARSIDSSSVQQFPEAKSPYGHVTHGLRKIVPAELACKMGCNGIKCKYDNSDWPKENMAIPGLFSNWITEDILAMARPRTDLINNNNIIHHFKKAEIRSIFNLQSRGEHKDCGLGLEKESGFSYNPIDFTAHGIYYYNYELEDYNKASCRNMIDMVKVLCFALQEGKAAVHCHAGLGRTGFFIACYLIYTRRISANEAIFMIRKNRPNSVQMQVQIDGIKEFEKYLKPLRIVYSYSIFDKNLETGEFNESSNFDLRTFLNRQGLLLHGYESIRLKYIPKVLFMCGEQIKKLLISWKTHGIDNFKIKEIRKYAAEFVDEILSDTGDKRKKSKDETDPNIVIVTALISNDNYPKTIRKQIEYYQNELNETNSVIEEIMNEMDPNVLAGLIWSWLDHLKAPVLKEQEVNILFKDIPYETMSSKINLKEFSKWSINWKELDTGTLSTINYLAGVFYDMHPIPDYLEELLIIQFISSLTQTSQRSEEYESELLHTSKIRLKKNQFKLLKYALQELIRNPENNPKISILGNFNFKKDTVIKRSEFNYDYGEEVIEPYPESEQFESNQGRESRSRTKRL